MTKKNYRSRFPITYVFTYPVSKKVVRVIVKDETEERRIKTDTKKSKEAGVNFEFKVIERGENG